MDGDDYWNTSLNKSFSFDDDIEEKLLDDNTSEISNVSSSTAINLNLIISDSDLQIVLEDQMVTEPIFPKVTLEEEVKVLRRKLHEYQYCPVAITVNKLLFGKPCSLSIYKSLRDKQELLDGVISCGNGDAILQVTMFLKATLKPLIFNQLLCSRPGAVDHYVEFLSTTMKIGEASELLMVIGRQQEAAIIQFKATALSKNVIPKLETLKKIKDLFAQPGCNQFIAQQVLNYVSLLELQIKDRLYFQPHDILEKSVIETLYRSCEKFNKWSDGPATNSTLNPYKIMENFSVTPAQFEWIALNERGKSQAWRDIEGLFEKKSVLKKKTFAIHIPLELVIIRLHHLHAPQALLNSFLNHVDDSERRLALSKKVGAINSIVESLVALKDKSALEVFKAGLQDGTAEYYLAEKAITNLSTTKSILGLRKSSSTAS